MEGFVQSFFQLLNMLLFEICNLPQQLTDLFIRDPIAVLPEGFAGVAFTDNGGI